MNGIGSLTAAGYPSREAAAGDADPCSGLRTILVPADIIPVKRQSPVRARKRTPWHPQPDGAAVTERSGHRDWFGDGVFVEPQHEHARAGFGASVSAHAMCGCALTVLVLLRTGAPPVPTPTRSLVMPAMVANVPLLATATPASRPAQAPQTSTPPPAAAAPASTRPLDAAAPVTAPSGIEPESGLEPGAGGVDGGIPGGLPDGVVGGLPDGAPSTGPAAIGPLRAGVGIAPPRKIKDVKPVYPQLAVAEQASGVVIIEATIGFDGKVVDVRVLRSIPALDKAALDAVRQWEYAPSLMNGMPVQVVMTVLVTFAIQ